MSEETNINNKISYFLKYKKALIYFLASLATAFIVYLFLDYYKKKNNINISEKYNSAMILLSNEKKNQSKKMLINVIEAKNKFYSPLALNTIIDKNLETSKTEVLKYFDLVDKIRGLEKDKKELFKLKRAIFISEDGNENEILQILNPIINSKSIWRTSAISFLEKYYIAQNQREKAKEFYNKQNEKN